MAGADVEITIIRQKTYAALLATLGAGAATLILAGLVSVRVARTLTAPLGRVREAALRIASGHYTFRCAVDSPSEMAALGRALNRLGGVMQTTIDQTRPRLAAWRRQRGARALCEALAIEPYRSEELGIAVASDLEASGYAVEGDAALVWVGEREADALSARKAARDIEYVARRMLKRHGAAAGEPLRSVFGSRLRAWAVVDCREWTVRLDGRGLDVQALRPGTPGMAGSAGEGAFAVPPGHAVILVASGHDSAAVAPTVAGPSEPAAIASLVASRTRSVAAVVSRAAVGTALSGAGGAG
jgi:hypothetical protein